jgi:uncharacterized repeat protein (TIGR03803 family)
LNLNFKKHVMKNVYHFLKAPAIVIFIMIVIGIKTNAQTLWGMTSAGGSENGGNIFSLHTDGTNFGERYAFLQDGAYPQSQRLLDYGDGYLYGAISTTTTTGGIVYKMLPDGTNYQLVYNFSGVSPSSGVLEGPDGYLYGTFTSGSHGGIYKISSTGTGYQVLHYFTGADGNNPYNELLFSGGIIYGTTNSGGTYNLGVMYSIKTDGTAFTVMHQFTTNTGGNPNGGLSVIASRQGAVFYGTTQSGGFNGLGVLYQVNLAGNAYQALYNFVSTMGIPSGSLARNASILYGCTKNGGSNGGIMYSYNTSNGNITAFHPFTYDQYGNNVQSPNGVLLYINNVLYGSTEQGGSFHSGVVFKMNPDGTGYQVLYSLTDPDGSFGNLSFYNNQVYGLTHGGQITGGQSNGTIYRLNTDGSSFQQIHRFSSANGYAPPGSLVQASDGNLYGTTTYGGSGYSNGVAFKIKTDGTGYTPVAWLDDEPAAGNSQGSIMQASNGSFYGTNKTSGPTWSGSIYKLAVSPLSYQQFYPFCPAPGCGNYPTGSLLQASDGYLYGTSTGSGQTGTYGTVFRINTDGSGYLIIHTFNILDGSTPAGSLIQAPDGFLYGVAYGGSTGTTGTGVIFKMKTDGSLFQDIFQFGTGYSGVYGNFPSGKLLRGADGKLYGMALRGGTTTLGTIFRLNTDGTGAQTLANLNSTTGYFPLGSLIQDPNTGVLYGMASQGGAYNMGTAFKLNTDGTGFVKLVDFNGTNGKNPKGDLLLLPAGSPLKVANGVAVGNLKIPVNSDIVISVEIAPNPVQNSFTIHFKKSTAEKLYYTLTDMNGKIIKQSTIHSDEGNFSQQIEVAGLPAGIYILKAGIGSRQFIKKIVKQ